MIKYTALLSILILFLFCPILADEIDDKMFQLRKIEKQIDELQQKSKMAEQQKKKAQSEIKSSQKLKSEADIRALKLQQKEEVAQDSLLAANQRVRSNEEKITDSKILANKEFLRLFYIDMQDKYIAKATRDKYLLSLLISMTTRYVSDLSEYHKKLIKEQEEHRREYIVAKRNKTKEIKKSEQYKKKIQSLSIQTTKLEKEKIAYDQQVEKLKKDAAELEKLIRRLTALSDRSLNTYQFSGKKIPWPVKGKVIREFGEESRGHSTSVINNGIDIAVPEGTSVISVDDGVVVFSDRYGGQGKLIIIDHKNGYFTVYAYNNELLVSKGAQVKKGQVVAKSGKTGSATQPSLHFELRKDGRAINPLSYLE